MSLLTLPISISACLPSLPASLFYLGHFDYLNIRLRKQVGAWIKRNYYARLRFLLVCSIKKPSFPGLECLLGCILFLPKVNPVNLGVWLLLFHCRLLFRKVLGLKFSNRNNRTNLSRVKLNRHQNFRIDPYENLCLFFLSEGSILS